MPLKTLVLCNNLLVHSGGYNLKTGAGSMIELMKFDMGGCAAVLGTCMWVVYVTLSLIFFP